jgi:hypothetical protein
LRFAVANAVPVAYLPSYRGAVSSALFSVSTSFPSWH